MLGRWGGCLALTAQVPLDPLGPIDTNGHSVIRPVAKQLDDGHWDRLAIEQIDLGFVVGQIMGWAPPSLE